MTTALQIVEDAGGLLQVTGMTAEEKDDSLRALNSWLSEISASPTGIFKITRENFSITSASNVYTIGSGGDFDTVIPTRIWIAFIRVGTQDYEVNPLLTAAEYAEWPLKSFQRRPTELYFERDDALGSIFVVPKPDQTYDLHLWSQKPLAQYSALSDSLGLPPDYEPFLKYNLALEIAPNFGANVTDLVFARANKTRKAMERINTEIPQIRTDVLGGINRTKLKGRTFDILSSSFYRR